MLNPRKRARRSQLSLDQNSSGLVGWDDTTARSSFDVTTPSNFDENNLGQEFNYPVDFSTFDVLCSSTTKSITLEVPSSNQKKSSSTNLPIDYRVGSRARLVFDFTLPILSQNYANNKESMGEWPIKITPHEYNQALSLSFEPENKHVFSTTNSIQILQHAAIYYQFPALGSVQMFPRLTTSSSNILKMSRTANLQSIESHFMDSMIKEWSEAFDNLYKSWLELQTASTFYLFSSSFTVLFLGHTNGVPSSFAKNDTNQHTIVITPTTSGFRQTLRDKGIEFELPFKVNFVDTGRDENPQDYLPPTNDTTVDLDHDEWLKEIGIGQTALRLKRTFSEIDMPTSSNDTLNNSAHSSKRSSLESDDLSRSTIIITDRKSIEKFCFLMYECKLGSTKTGPQSGLPPTLISKSPFRKCSLRELNMVYKSIKKNGQMKYIVELDDGPILPSVPETLVKFLKSLPNCTKQVKVQISGKSSYAGINEALLCHKADKNVCNYDEFEWDPVEKRFCW